MGDRRRRRTLGGAEEDQAPQCHAPAAAAAASVGVGACLGERRGLQPLAAPMAAGWIGGASKPSRAHTGRPRLKAREKAAGLGESAQSVGPVSGYRDRGKTLLGRNRHPPPFLRMGSPRGEGRRWPGPEGAAGGPETPAVPPVGTSAGGHPGRGPWGTRGEEARVGV